MHRSALRAIGLVLAYGTVLALPMACVATARIPLDSNCRAAARIEGQPVLFTLDTGSPTMALTTATAERLSLPVKPTEATVTDSTGLQRPPSGVAEFTGFQLGTLSGSGEALCLPMPPSVGDGLLGMEMLQHGCWIFDLGAGVLCMTCGDLADELLAQHGYRATCKLPLGDDPLRPAITVRVEQREDVVLPLDTGAGGTSLPTALVERLGLPDGARLARQQAEARERALQAAFQANATSGVAITVTVPPDDGTRVGVHGEPERNTLHHLPRLELGGVEIADLLVTARGDEGRLGRDVLGAFPWLLHGPRRELWVLTKQ